MWLAQPNHFLRAQLDRNIPVARQTNARTLYLQSNSTRIRARRSHDIVFKLPFAKIKNYIDAWIQMGIPHSAKLRNTGVPKLGIRTREIAAGSRQLLDSHHFRLRVRALKLQPEIPRSPPGRGFLPGVRQHDSRSGPSQK